jgi:hypothetical protein
MHLNQSQVLPEKNIIKTIYSLLLRVRTEVLLSPLEKLILLLTKERKYDQALFFLQQIFLIAA